MSQGHKLQSLLCFRNWDDKQESYNPTPTVKLDFHAMGEQNRNVVTDKDQLPSLSENPVKSYSIEFGTEF